MSTFVNFVSGNIHWWFIGALVSGILTAVFGIRWEKSGKTEELRKKWMSVVMKIFAFVATICALATVLALVIIFWRAVLRG
ncbi:MAG: hypothetical protein RLZZ347_215 [Candidatus Parcubacteria bacterium]|jgi:hypothetical protein